MGRPLKIQKQGYAGSPGSAVDAAYPQINTLTNPVTPSGLTGTNFYGVVGGNVLNSQNTGYPNADYNMADGTATFPVVAVNANIYGSGQGPEAAFITRQKGQSKYLVTGAVSGATGVCFLANVANASLTANTMSIGVGVPDGTGNVATVFLQRLTNKYGLSFPTGVAQANVQYFVNFFEPQTIGTATLGNVNITGTAGTFSSAAFSSTLLVNDPVTVSGTTTNPTLATVVITGTAGQFSCAATARPMVVGQKVTISGTFGGTGSIDTPAYSDPTTYYIIATNGSTTFTLSDTLGGAAVVTTAGTPTGVTYTLTAGTIVGYSNPTTYYVAATNGSTTFTLSASVGGAAVTSTAGGTTGLTFTVASAVVSAAKSGADAVTFTNGTGQIALAQVPSNP